VDSGNESVMGSWLIRPLPLRFPEGRGSGRIGSVASWDADEPDRPLPDRAPAESDVDRLRLGPTSGGQGPAVFFARDLDSHEAQSLR
jgi:hypothetical protein